MKKLLFIILISFICMADLSAASECCDSANSEIICPKKKTLLWNGKNFDGLVLFLKSEDADPKKTWAIKNGVIDCTGKPSGYFRTEKKYANYKLHVEWRWNVEALKALEKSGAKMPKNKNSGVIVHMQGEDKVWPISIECQLMTGNAGDFFVIGGTEFKEHADMVKDWKPPKPKKTAPGKKPKKPRGPSRRVPKQGDSAEKPLGEWNSYDIVCKDDSIIVNVNGQLKNKATETSVKSGNICIQSEGSPIQFRNIYIEPVK